VIILNYEQIEVTMFFPSSNSIIDRINSEIFFDRSKNINHRSIASLNSYRGKVLTRINLLLTEETRQEIWDAFYYWWQKNNDIDYWYACREQKDFKEMADWIIANFWRELQIEQKLKEQQTKEPIKIPSESDLEDALQWVENTDFQGSEKQVKWAKSIALKNLQEIVSAWKKGIEIPIFAKWWIENRGNINF
jgi:hypothetical protein